MSLLCLYILVQAEIEIKTTVQAEIEIKTISF